MPCLPRFSNWDILSSAYLPKDIKPPPARSIRFGRPHTRLRFKLGSRAFSIRPIVPIVISLVAIDIAVQYGFIFPAGSQIDPALRRALQFGATLLIFAVAILTSIKYVDPALVAYSRVRTTEVRRALAMQRRGSLDAAKLEQLAELLAGRSRQAMSKGTDGMTYPGAARVIFHTQSHRLVFLLVVFLPALVGEYGKLLPWLHVPIMLTPMAALATLYLIGSRLPHRLASAAAHRNCIDCNYPLADLPSPFDVAPGQPIPSSGPERCPECGSPWPLVPPRLY